MSEKLGKIVFISYPNGTTKQELTQVVSKVLEEIRSLPLSDELSNEFSVHTIDIENTEQNPIVTLCRNLIRKFGEPDSTKTHLWIAKFVCAYYSPKDREVNAIVVNTIKNVNAKEQVLIELNRLGFLYSFLISNNL